MHSLPSSSSPPLVASVAACRAAFAASRLAAVVFRLPLLSRVLPSAIPSSLSPPIVVGGKPGPPTRWDPQGRAMTVHLESLIDQSELYVTNGYAPQAGREGADADILTFGQSMNAAAQLHSTHAPHVMGMDGNGGPPGYEAGTPNDAWIAQLLSPDSGNYSRAGRPRPTHYSVKGGSKGGTVGWRAAVYHAVLNASKRKSATAASITGSWVALPECLWRPGADDPASVTAIAARRLGVAARRTDDLDPSWRDFALYRVDHEEPPVDPAGNEAATYVLVANEHTVPAGTAYHAEVRLTLAQLFPPVNDWHNDKWTGLNDKLKPNRVPPAQPGVLHKPWVPRTHLQAPQHDTVDDDGWIRARANSEETIQRAIAEATAVAEADRATEAAPSPAEERRARGTVQGQRHEQGQGQG